MLTKCYILQVYLLNRLSKHQVNRPGRKPEPQIEFDYGLKPQSIILWNIYCHVEYIHIHS